MSKEMRALKRKDSRLRHLHYNCVKIQRNRQIPHCGEREIGADFRRTARAILRSAANRA
jgi:hypothetical protein